jgi:hypothetical protein
MQKFTTQQLQDALIGLRNTVNLEAYYMTYDEVCMRMGEDAFDAWCDALGW